MKQFLKQTGSTMHTQKTIKLCIDFIMTSVKEKQ